MHSQETTPIVVVIDNDKDRAKGMMQAFSNYNCTTINLWKDGIGKVRVSGSDEILRHCTILLWHVGDVAGTWADIPADLLIYYSGNGGNDERFPTKTQERIWRPVKIGPVKPDSGVLSEIEAGELLNYVREVVAGHNNTTKPACLEPDNHYLPTLAMLYQGYLAIHAQYDQSKSKWKPQEIVPALRTMGWIDFIISDLPESWLVQEDFSSEQTLVSQTSWWLKVLDLVNANGTLNQSKYQEFQVAIDNEWDRLNQSNSFPESLQTLLSGIVSQSEITSTQVTGFLITPVMVADAYCEIAEQLKISSFVQKHSYITPEAEFEYLLAIRKSSVSVATSTVLSYLLDTDLLLLNDDALPEPLNLPKQSLLIVTERQLNILPALRLRDFRGAVLVLSRDSFDSIKQKHPILRWGQGSHDVCPLSCTLPTLLTKVAKLFPLEPENFALLQNQLRAPVSWLQERVIPLLGALQSNDANRQQYIDELATIIQELRFITPVVYHAIADIGGQSLQIQQHFQTKLDFIRNAQQIDEEALTLLKQVFEQWRDLVIEVGEGQGAFS